MWSRSRHNVAPVREDICQSLAQETSRKMLKGFERPTAFLWSSGIKCPVQKSLKNPQYNKQIAVHKCATTWIRFHVPFPLEPFRFGQCILSYLQMMMALFQLQNLGPTAIQSRILCGCWRIPPASLRPVGIKKNRWPLLGRFGWGGLVGPAAPIWSQRSLEERRGGPTATTAGFSRLKSPGGTFVTYLSPGSSLSPHPL